MRRRLILMVVATTSILLVAMLVPIGILIDRYAASDQLVRASLELQATETVVAGLSKGEISTYLDALNRDDPGLRTLVIFPDDTRIGAGQIDESVLGQVRSGGIAQLESTPEGTAIIAPVALGERASHASDPEEAGVIPVVQVEAVAAGYLPGVYRAWLTLGLLGLLLLALSVWLADRIGRSFVRPLEQLGGHARVLATGQAPEPLHLSPHTPSEITQIATALARLTSRVQELLTREREHVGNLSHRLRTPITALRLDIESLPPSQDRTELLAGVDRLSDTVDDVVREARRGQREGIEAYTDFTRVVRERTEFWQVLAEEQHRPWRVELPSVALTLRASAEDLQAMVDVLIDNIFTHTPETAAVHLSLEQISARQAVLTVADTGPGLPAGVDVMARGTSTRGSTGLGFSIAQSTLRALGGQLEIQTQPNEGTQLRLLLPLADPTNTHT